MTSGENFMHLKKVGLVLSGGGAKGAYQVGVAKALVESGVDIAAISGASIGSLNGAVLASAPSFSEGAKRLEEIWEALASDTPIKPNFPYYLRLLAALGLRLRAEKFLQKIIREASIRLGKKFIQKIPFFKNFTGSSEGTLENDAFFSNTKLAELIKQYCNENNFAQGLPLYVSVYRYASDLRSLSEFIFAELGIKDTPNSKFLHIQSLSSENQRKALMASAAIPLLFSPQKINDALYSDGGQGGWFDEQGNTPITPLVENGYQNIIVIHLSKGSLWSRHNFPDNVKIIEIRPRDELTHQGKTPDLLTFDINTIPKWSQQGYDDTVYTLNKIAQALATQQDLEESEQRLETSLNRIKSSRQQADKAMDLIRNQNYTNKKLIE
ncbi:patatin-like phospholipase family protein [Desulfococcaceae bacterium OttesenSCG-928-F15]|nr:patatin-like phospholipase family protein [Desulfococcaceae bacterium OttesenSCG-928-F15]